RAGQLSTLIWLRNRGCAWSSDTRGGHLDVLHYAHEHGCPWAASGRICKRRGRLKAKRDQCESRQPCDYNSPRRCTFAEVTPSPGSLVRNNRIY
ncbi:hypothetical protein T492DRAFT_606886, partial [Pavlovales sp. CCMP2436]